ncbi:uncharacterized protein At4g15970-like [Humulus lupulus]|uniref:uncharacterized protein At4g15970-like n=1 Tax=Humulus lupulus TaxID=3486 RepID=UPI002B4160F9|nr:uncharacterized protein At4g15970-like [Humulus lupulus]
MAVSHVKIHPGMESITNIMVLISQDKEHVFKPKSLAKMRKDKPLRLIKSQFVPLLAFFIILITCCIVLISSTKSSSSDGACGTTSIASQNSKNLERNELLHVLRRISMEDRTVILTGIVDEAWTSPGSVLDLFLESFRLGQGTQMLLNHLLIVTVGNETLQHCNSLHPHCLELTPLGSINNLLLEVLKLGYSFFFTEVDVMWFRTPVLNINPMKEITIPCDIASYESESESNRPGRGLFYVKSTERAIELFRYWKVLGILYQTFHVESLCENLKEHQEYIEMLGVHIHYLDTAYFGGFCRGGSKDMNMVYTMHANCCQDVENKVYDLRLVLDGWRNFTAQPSNFRSGMVPSWRAPTKCIA